jgi:GrpB-like predicted nucleotidyltransferase (UPF0157 family)
VRRPDAAPQPARHNACVPVVYVISGPMAAGKTTVARPLAERFERGVHLEGDVFRRSIVSGRVEMTPDLSPAALEQLELRYRLAAAAADGYADAGFSVVLEDVIAGSFLGPLRTAIRTRPCHVVVLLPSLEALRAREAGRAQKGYTAWTVEELHAGFAERTPRVGIWLDTTELTADQTVAVILERTARERSPVVVVDYQHDWPALFERLATPLRRAVAHLDAATVEHVGSTAVPGLAAKPIVDIDVVLDSAADVPAAVEALRGLGYVYQGDKGIRGREAFMWPPEAPAHHVYVVVAGSAPHRNHVGFRDHLRTHPEDARRYAELKGELAAAHAGDVAAYAAGKQRFIDAIVCYGEACLPRDQERGGS